MRIVFGFLGALLLALLTGLAWLAWTLSEGPLPLTLATPYVEDMLADQFPGLRLQVGGADLRWEGSTRALELYITHVTILDNRNIGVATVPYLSLDLHPRSLLKGQVRLRSIELLRPYVEINRTEDGRVELGVWHPEETLQADGPVAEAGPSFFDLLLQDLLRGTVPEQAEAGDSPIAHLEAVRILNADALLTDRMLDIEAKIPELTLELFRSASGTLEVAATAILIKGDQTSHVDLLGEFDPRRDHLELDMAFGGIHPATVSSLNEDLAPLAAIDFPVSGHVYLAALTAPIFQLDTLRFAILGEAGTLRLPAPISHDYAIAAFSLDGELDQGLKAVLLDRLVLDLHGPRIVAEGTAHLHDSGAVNGEVTVMVAQMPLDRLAQDWPETVAPNPRPWVTENLSAGMVTQGDWHLVIAGDSLEDADVVDLRGSARVEGARVDYLAPMPPAINATAAVGFTLDSITVAVETAQVAEMDVSVVGGTITLSDLDKEDVVQYAEIALDLTSSLGHALRLIDSPPLGYTSKLGLDPAAGRGQAVVHLDMAVPLLNDVLLDDLRVNATATVRGGSLRGAVFGQDLTEATLTLRADTQALTAEGSGAIGGIPTRFQWHEVFSGSPYSSRYQATALVPEDRREVFGLTFVPFIPPYLTGPVAATLDVYSRRGVISIEVDADLAEAGIHIPGFDWTKAPGLPARGLASLVLHGDRLHEVSHFIVEAQGRDAFGDDSSLRASGAVSLHSDGSLDRVTLDDVILGQSHVTGWLTLDENGIVQATARGPFVDVRPLIGRAGSSQDGAAAEEEDGPPAFALVGDFGHLRLGDGDEDIVQAVSLVLERSDTRWDRVVVDGAASTGVPFSFHMIPVLGGEDGRRTLAVSSPDAGAFIRSLGVFDTARGGTLTLSGEVDPHGAAQGVLTIDSFRLVDAPMLARLLSVAALTGIVDAMTGEGLAFDTLEAPFSFSPRRVITLNNARAHGASLGMTAAGRIDLSGDTLDLSGTLVPAYVLNSLLGRVPLIGGLLTGFETGGGVFAANYSLRGPLDDPSITVNPLSALTPGILRRVFSLFDGEGSGEEEGEATPPADPLSLIPP